MNKEIMLQAELNRKLVELKNAKAKIDKLNKEIEMYKEQINAYEMDDELPEVNND
jgi:vacuolar-type H+-ATPase subunit D/Vma8